MESAGFNVGELKMQRGSQAKEAFLSLKLGTDFAEVAFHKGETGVGRKLVAFWMSFKVQKPLPSCISPHVDIGLGA